MVKDYFVKENTFALKGVLSLIIMCSHLYYVEPLLLFNIANKLGTSAVSLFLFISGFGLASSYVSKGKEYLSDFFTRRFWKVLKPLILVVLLYLFLQFLISGEVRHFSIEGLFHDGNTYLPNTWFVYTLLLHYLFFYLCFRLVHGSKIWIPIVCISLLSFGFITFTYINGFERCWWVTTLSFPTGVLYGQYKLKLLPIIRNSWTIILGLIIVVIVILSKIEILLLIPYIIIPLVVVVIFSYLGIIFTHPLLSFFGCISYELYLIHGIFINLFRSEAITINSPLFYSLAVIFCSICMAFLLHRISGVKLFKV